MSKISHKASDVSSIFSSVQQHFFLLLFIFVGVFLACFWFGLVLVCFVWVFVWFFLQLSSSWPLTLSWFDTDRSSLP